MTAPEKTVGSTGWEKPVAEPPEASKRRKKTPFAFSAWEYVGNDVLKALQGEPPKTIGSTQLTAIVVVGINPKALAESIKNEKAHELARLFTDFYARKPDLTIRLLEVIRKRWENRSLTARVQKHVTTKAWHVQPIWENGKCIRPGVLTADVKDSVLQALLTGETEGEKMQNAYTARKARQRIKAPPLRLTITEKLHGALQELRERGFEIGSGT
jgi:hypothetical protein